MDAMHTADCLAHAIGCAVENIAEWDAETRAKYDTDPVAQGTGYLTDDTVTCVCETGPSPLAAATVAAGYRALALAAEAAIRQADIEVQAAQGAEYMAARATRAAEARRDALRADLEAARAAAVAANRAQREAERAAALTAERTVTSWDPFEGETHGYNDAGAQIVTISAAVRQTMWTRASNVRGWAVMDGDNNILARGEADGLRAAKREALLALLAHA